MSALDVSLVPRVSLRLGYRSRPIRICNDMSLSLLPFLSIFTGFQHECFKVGTFGIIADFDCHLHHLFSCQAFICFPWPVLDNINFQGLFVPLIWLSTGYSFKPLGKVFFILMVSKPEPTNNQVI